MRSGGVGILLKDTLLADVKVYKIVEQFESVLCVVLKHEVRDYKVGIIAGYLPPENTKYGCDPGKFFEIQTQLAYMYNDCDDLIIGRDYNACIGDKTDYIADVDKVAPRFCIDDVCNNHGNSFIEFLTDTRVGVINGRITPVYDNFTSISGKGTSIVDYLCASYEIIPKNCGV